MKKSILASVVALVGLSASVAFADPTSVVVDVTCPGTSGVSNVLSNFGNFVQGAGTLSIEGMGSSSNVYFNYSMQSTDTIPHKLGNYSNSGTDYDPVMSMVYCSYTSSNSGESPFTVGYLANNLAGGSIDINNQTASSIRIFTTFGLKHA